MPLPQPLLLLPALLIMAGAATTLAVQSPSAPATGPAAQVIFPDDDWQRATPQSQGVDSALLEEAMALIPSISGKDGNAEVLVIRNGYVIWEGPRVGRIHPIYSCTKSFASTVLGLLVADGKCTPDTLVADVLPEMREHYPTLTLAQLSSLTSGVHFDDEGQPAEPLFAPGTRFHYDSGPTVLMKAMTVLAGRPIAELFHERIAGPIGMSGYAWAWEAHDETTDGIPVNGGGSGFVTNALTFARFGWLMCNDGRWKDEQLIAPEWVRLATTPQHAGTLPTYRTEEQAGRWYVRIPGAYGLGWHVNTGNYTGQSRWPSAPAGMFLSQGANENLCFVVPEWRLILVRGSTDGYHDLEEWDKVLALLGRAIEAGEANTGE